MEINLFRIIHKNDVNFLQKTKYVAEFVPKCWLYDTYYISNLFHPFCESHRAHNEAPGGQVLTMSGNDVLISISHVGLVTDQIIGDEGNSRAENSRSKERKRDLRDTLRDRI